MMNSDEPLPIDDIVEQSGLNSSDVLVRLFNLEIRAWLRQMPASNSVKVLL